MYRNSIPHALIAAMLLTPFPPSPETALSFQERGPGGEATFTVDTRGDAVDANPGDGMCATVEGKCTLRAAIQETNAVSGVDTITLPAGSYVLSIPGAMEDASATGDLDITDEVTITGAGLELTAINGRGSITADRAFHILGTATVTISGVTIGHGRANKGGGIFNQGGLTLEGSRLHSNAAVGSGGGIENTGLLRIVHSQISNNHVTGPDSLGGGVYNKGSGGIASVVISNSRLIGNTSVVWGGGIYQDGSATLAVNQSAISGNSALIGGGIYNFNGAVTVTYTTLSGNSAEDGGGILNNSFGGEGIVTVSHSTLRDNAATNRGGAIYLQYTSEITVTDSTFSGNSADTGGVLFNDAGTAEISNSTLFGNSARLGGAIHSSSTDAVTTVTNSTLSRNQAEAGGGIYMTSGAVTLSHSTVTGNSAQDGGGLYYIFHTLTMKGTILAGNTASSSGPDCAGSTIHSAGYNLVGNNSECDFIQSEGDLVGTPADPIDPLLGPLQDNGGPTFTQALLAGSPAIDTGNPDECPPTDQRGYPRPIDGDGNGSAICDIGSFEFGSTP